MQLAMCSIGFQRQGKWAEKPVIEVPVTDVARQVATAGLTGLEIWEPHYGSLDVERRALVRHRLVTLGLAVPMLSSYYNFTKSREHARASLANGHRVLGLAVELGCPRLRIFTGNHRSADASREQWWRCRDCLRELCDAAADHGIRLCLETHDWNLMDTVPGTLRLLELVHRPNLRVNFQPSTFMPGQLAALRALAPWIDHVHATNARGRLDNGRMDWRDLIAGLQRIGYAGWISIEWFGDRAGELLATQGAWMRRRLAEVGAA